VTILVLGLNEGRHKEVAAQCPGVKIRFVEPERANFDVGGAEFVVIVAKFISHKAVARVPRSLRVFSRGGMGNLVSTLNRLGGRK
jgi:hypothetical protein